MAAENARMSVLRSSPGGNGDTRAREVAVAFEGMLLREALAPLAKPLGFYGDLVLGACTQAVAERSHAGLATALQSLLERTRRDTGAQP
jgi:hypothetical protein